jgi:LacI family transcriptional regulator
MADTGDSDQVSQAAPIVARLATIRDVARAAGVSPGTVSKVLGHSGGLSAATRERVLDASRALNYRPNELARGIFARRSFTVGLITSDSYGRFSGPIMAGAEDALGLGELSVIMCDSRGDVRRERAHLETLIGRRVDGLIVTGRCSNIRPSVASDSPFPVVYAHTPSVDPDDVSIMVDDYGAGVLAGEHLVAQGRRRIAHITGPWGFDAVRKRLAGLQSVLDGHGLELVGEPAMAFWCEAWGREATMRLIDAHPDVDAIYCGSDLLARAVIDTLRELGRSVPSDIAVVGTDNWELIAEATRPPLTTVDLNLYQVGRASAEALVDAIAGTKRSGTTIVPADLVVRESSGVPYDEANRPHGGNYHDSCIHVDDVTAA